MFGDYNILPFGETLAVAAVVSNMRPGAEVARIAETLIRSVNSHDDLVAALASVQKLISEAAMTGFNWQDGDWPQRLFESQRVTSAALRKARGQP